MDTTYNLGIRLHVDPCGLRSSYWVFHLLPTPSTLPRLPLPVADTFETMLKSLLGYQSGGGGASEAVLRKKVYENAINHTLKNNFSTLPKVCVSGGATISLL